MMGQLFLNLLLAHVVGDFYCQTGRSCLGKREKGLKGSDLYVHALIILVLSWLDVGMVVLVGSLGPRGDTFVHRCG